MFIPFHSIPIKLILGHYYFFVILNGIQKNRYGEFEFCKKRLITSIVPTLNSFIHLLKYHLGLSTPSGSPPHIFYDETVIFFV